MRKIKLFLYEHAPPHVHEVWKVIGGWSMYEVSNLGEVRRLHIDHRSTPFHVLRQWTAKNGYKCVHLRNQGSNKTTSVAKLVAQAFIGNRPKNREINHKDGIKVHNDVRNLEYITHSENLKHAIRLGLKPILKGEQHGYAKLTDAQAGFILESPESAVNLAKRFRVSTWTIFKIRSRKTWRHIS